jgi:Skp family chaperone for outer membrane proteins
MNRYLALGCLGLGLLVSPLLGALRGAQSAVPQNPRIGVIDETALLATPAGKRAFEPFEKARKQKQTDLDKNQADLRKAAADLDKQKPVLKEDVYKAKRDELEKKFVELQQTYLKLERELAADEAKAREALAKQAGPQIEKVAKAEGVSIIIERGAIVWADATMNLTDKIVAELK